LVQRTGVSPAELILSHAIRLSAHILAAVVREGEPVNIALAERMDAWIERQHTLLIAAQDNQQQADQHRLVLHDPDITEYPVNSYVLYTPPSGHDNKLVARHRGPYQIIECNTSIYIIEDLLRDKRITTHVHNFRPFIYDPAYTNPTSIVQQNEQEFAVAQILGHREDPQRRATMEFLVSWTDFGADQNSWEPYKALMHVDVLHAYLRRHRMRTLIPKEHK